MKLALTVSVLQVPHPGSSPAAQAPGIWRNERPGTLIPFKDSFKEIRRVRSILLYFSPRLFLFLKYLFTYLFGCTRSYLWQAGSLVVAFELLVAACMWDLVP